MNFVWSIRNSQIWTILSHLVETPPKSPPSSSTHQIYSFILLFIDIKSTQVNSTQPTLFCNILCIIHLTFHFLPLSHILSLSSLSIRFSRLHFACRFYFIFRYRNMHNLLLLFIGMKFNSIGYLFEMMIFWSTSFVWYLCHWSWFPEFIWQCVTPSSSSLPPSTTTPTPNTKTVYTNILSMVIAWDFSYLWNCVSEVL